jgi:GT2 family glycosyltransferase
MSLPDTKHFILERFPQARFFEHKENIGYSRCVNKGIEESKGAYLLVLNSDLVVENNAIETMLNYIKKNPDIGILAPRLCYFNGEHQQSYFRFYTPTTIIARRTIFGRLAYFKKIEDEFLMRESNPNQIQTPDWVMGSAMMTSREAVEKIGGMDADNFFMYFEDVDWCRRFWHAGYKVVYYPSAIMYHYLGRGSKSKLGIFDALLNKKTHWHIQSAIRFFRKYKDMSQKKNVR